MDGVCSNGDDARGQGSGDLWRDSGGICAFAPARILRPASDAVEAGFNGLVEDHLQAVYAPRLGTVVWQRVPKLSGTVHVFGQAVDHRRAPGRLHGAGSFPYRAEGGGGPWREILPHREGVAADKLSRIGSVI